jgi:NADPH:quinone reductase
MRAAYYERQGPAASVLKVGELPLPEPGPGEVRVRITFSGVNPGDTKKRQDWLGYGMSAPRIVPHSDGAGVVEAVGTSVTPARLGRRVWIYGAQSGRPFGTAAEATVVPSTQAVDLPDGVPDQVGAALGIPGITAWRAVFADGAVAGRTVLVHGVLGAVSSLAAQLARWGGARVVGTVRQAAQRERVPDHVASAVVALDHPDAVAEVRAVAPEGIDRIVEVALSENVELDAAVVSQGAVIAVYGSSKPRPELPFWHLLFSNVTLRLLGSDDFPAEAKAEAARGLTRAVAEGKLRIEVGPIFALDEVVAAHEAVERGETRGRVLVRVPR